MRPLFALGLGEHRLLSFAGDVERSRSERETSTERPKPEATSSNRPSSFDDPARQAGRTQRQEREQQEPDSDRAKADAALAQLERQVVRWNSFSRFKESVAKYPVIADGDMGELKREVKRQLELDPLWDERAIKLTMRPQPSGAVVIEVVDAESQREIGKLRVDLPGRGAIRGQVRHEETISELQVQPLSRYGRELLRWPLVGEGKLSESKVAEIKLSVKRELGIAQQLGQRPIILTVSTARDGITLIDVNDQATGRGFAQLKLDQNRNGLVVSSSLRQSVVDELK